MGYCRFDCRQVYRANIVPMINRLLKRSTSTAWEKWRTISPIIEIPTLRNSCKSLYVILVAMYHITTPCFFTGMWWHRIPCMDGSFQQSDAGYPEIQQPLLISPGRCNKSPQPPPPILTACENSILRRESDSSQIMPMVHGAGSDLLGHMMDFWGTVLVVSQCTPFSVIADTQQRRLHVHANFNCIPQCEETW